jgi:hypothetical protein
VVLQLSRIMRPCKSKVKEGSHRRALPSVILTKFVGHDIFIPSTELTRFENQPSATKNDFPTKICV